MVVVGMTAGFGNVHARFIGPLPSELRSKCIANFEGELHGQQAVAIEAACSANVADRVYVAAEYLVVTLSLLSLAVYAHAFAGAERRAQRSDAVPRKQALALFLGTDLAGLPWVILSPACFMVTYWSLVPLEVRRSYGPAPASQRLPPLSRACDHSHSARQKHSRPCAGGMAEVVLHDRVGPVGICAGSIHPDYPPWLLPCLPGGRCRMHWHGHLRRHQLAAARVGSLQFRAVSIHKPMGGRELVSRRG